MLLGRPERGGGRASSDRLAGRLDRPRKKLRQPPTKRNTEHAPTGATRERKTL